MSREARLGEKKKTTKQASHGLLSKIYKEYLNLNENMNILTEKFPFASIEDVLGYMLVVYNSPLFP